jgi:hypothetical protein
VSIDQVADVELWTQGIFDLSFNYLESLIKFLDRADFAILVLTPDDLTHSRGITSQAPRDNILFELGLFMGRLGRRRCFFVFERNRDLKLPTDLLGIAAATYQLYADGNIEAALGAATTKIKRCIQLMGRKSTLLGGEPSENAGLPDISGTWNGYSPDGPNPNDVTSILEIEQHGSAIRAFVERKVSTGVRRFEYEGRFSSGQVVLFFEDQRGRGFIIGTMVLHLSGNLNRLTGKSTYYDHTKKEVVSAERMYTRVD